MIKKTWQRVALLIATAFVAGLALLAGPTTTGPTAPQTAQANVIDTHFLNVGGMGVLMCRDWTTNYGDGRNSRGTCKYTKDGGRQGVLYPNERTDWHFGWADTDGFYVRRDYDVAIRRSGATLWNRWRPWGWWKKRGFYSSYQIKQYHE